MLASHGGKGGWNGGKGAPKPPRLRAPVRIQALALRPRWAAAVAAEAATVGLAAEAATGGGTGGGPGSGGGNGPGTDSGGTDNGIPPSTDSGTPAQPAPSTPAPAPSANVDESPSGGVVTEDESSDKGDKQSSRGTIDGTRGSSGSEDSGSRSGSGVNAVVASARPITSSATPVIAAAAAGTGSSESSSGSNSNKSSGSDKSEAPTVPRKRTTIARAVDGIPLAFRAALLLLIFATSILAVVSFRERRRATAVARVAQLDHLTGLANREGFDRQMAIEWQRALRHGRPLGMVFVDLDHFKAYNDTHGHVAGDRLLREVAAAITATARGSDFTARLGGDEFVVVCPDTEEAGLDRLVERLRVEASGMAVSLSIGAAAKLDSDASPDELVHRADVAMYAAKGGRRRGAKSANPMLGSLRSWLILN